MHTRYLICIALIASAVSLGQGFDEHAQHDPAPAGSDGNNNADADAPGERQESWIFVQIPRYGLASLQSVLEDGSPANLAWQAIGQPIELYQPVPMLAPTANENNGAISVLMLPERCLGDFDWDGSVGWNDAVLFTQIFLNGHDAADLSGDGVLDIRDQILFLHLSTVPCVDGW